MLSECSMLSAGAIFVGLLKIMKKMPINKNRRQIRHAQEQVVMNKKITAQNIKQIWDDAVHYHECIELEQAVLRLTHWLDQKPADIEFENDVKVVLAAAKLVLCKTLK